MNQEAESGDFEGHRKALRALRFAKNYAERRRNGKGRVAETPFVFPPSKNAAFVQQTSACITSGGRC